VIAPIEEATWVRIPERHRPTSREVARSVVSETSVSDLLTAPDRVGFLLGPVPEGA
jgi:hypothetical protein